MAFGVGDRPAERLSPQRCGAVSCSAAFGPRVSSLGGGLASQTSFPRSWSTVGFHRLLAGPHSPLKPLLSMAACHVAFVEGDMSEGCPVWSPLGRHPDFTLQCRTRTPASCFEDSTSFPRGHVPQTWLSASPILLEIARLCPPVAVCVPQVPGEDPRKSPREPGRPTSAGHAVGRISFLCTVGVRGLKLT